MDGKLIAFVGPNEAGKTSLLKALSHSSSSAKIPPSDATYAEDEEVYIITKFALDEDDLVAAELTQPSTLSVHKRSDGPLRYIIEPNPPRDLKHRKSSYALLREVDEGARSEDIKKALNPDKVDQVLSLLAGGSGAYSNAELKTLRELSSNLGEAMNNPALTDDGFVTLLNASMVELISFETGHDPHKDAVVQLSGRVPDILEFTSEYRDLQLPYNISLLNHQDAKTRRAPSLPLRKLLEISGLELVALQAAHVAKNSAEKTGIIDDANERLEEHCKGRWSQSDAFLQFVFDGGQLDVLVKHNFGFERRHRYNNLSDRSDGYRQFIALQIFSLLHDVQGATLLIDEMEQHLHYDAQADLVQMLTAEPKIGKVIYTTHSAGCLPEDLGSGVRLVQWDPDDKRRSQVLNKFWASDIAGGFAPLLFGMGATTLSFFPTRRVLLGEGPTELLLLPKLLKEALGAPTLGFQVLHGLSNLSLQGLKAIDEAATANGTAFILDNDKGGMDLKKALTDAGVPGDRIFELSEIAEDIVTLEDTLDNSIWLEAVNEYIQEFGSGMGVTQTLETAPDFGRIAALPDTIRTAKVNFAYNALRIKLADKSRPLIAERNKAAFFALGARIRNLLTSSD